jgi:hypothetical protein
LFIAPSPYTPTLCLWICTVWVFLEFKNCITYHTSQVVLFLCSPLRITWKKRVKGLWYCTKQNTRSALSTEDRPSQDVWMSPVQPLYFLDASHIFVQKFSYKAFITIHLILQPKLITLSELLTKDGMKLQHWKNDDRNNPIQNFMHQANFCFLSEFSSVNTTVSMQQKWDSFCLSTGCTICPCHIAYSWLILEVTRYPI